MIAEAKRKIGVVDLAILQLVRMVRDDQWSPSTAAARLRVIVDSDAVLRHARGRVQRALSNRPSEVAERARATLDLALARENST